MRPDRATVLLLSAVAAGAVLTIVARTNGWAALVWTFKPLTTIAIIVLAGVRGHGHGHDRYARWILAGLVFSLAGDVLLIPEGLFVAGLLAFLVAHVAYLRALTTDCRFAARRMPFAAVALVAAAIVAALWPGLPAALRLPVLVYVVALGAMCAQALARAATLGTAQARRAGLGAAFFMASDAMLAFDRFHTPLAWAPLLVLGTYYAAQSLIACSIGSRQSVGRSRSSE